MLNCAKPTLFNNLKSNKPVLRLGGTPIPTNEEVNITAPENLILRSSSDCFESAIDDQTSCNLYNETILINNHPDYPNCSFLIEYEYYFCVDLNTGQTTYAVGDFDLSIPYGSCNQYFNDVAAANSAGNIDQFTIDFNSYVYNRIRQDVIDVFPLWTPYPITVTFSISSCSKTCMRRVPGLKGDVYNYVIEKIDCGIECCKKTEIYKHEVYADPNSDWILISSIWELPEFPCEDNNEPCQTPSLFDTECIGRCEELVGF